MTQAHRVVIVGGGFGGLRAAQALGQAPVQVTIIDRRNFHLFQPLLYQVATGALSPANIAAPLRAILKKQKNANVLLGEVIGFDAARKRVLLADGEVEYDTLIVAAGVRHHYFGNDHWEALAPGLKTVEDATEIRRRILLAFEKAERDPENCEKWLTFVVVGGGPTGVELAGAVGEIANFTLRNNFRRIDPARARVLLLEGADRILRTYPAPLSANATEALNRLGVMVINGAKVTDVEPEGVTFERGGQTEFIATHTVLWAAGVIASPLGKALAEATGVALDRAGRVIVEPDLTLAGHPDVFVIGDLANFSHQTGQPLPGVAYVAMQQGQYVAKLIRARLRGRGDSARLFRYHDLASMATIGRASAVAVVKGLWLTGFIGWLAWLVVHLVRLIRFENRVLVLFQWAWNYFTRNRSARLITGDTTPGAAPLSRPADQPDAARKTASHRKVAA